MSERVEHYQGLVDAIDTESLTVVVVTEGSVDEVADALVADAGVPDLGSDPFEKSAYVVVPVSGGVLAIEYTGYADPHVRVLQRLSSDGRAVAVVRDNIQGHLRFGCARDGVLLVDNDEFMYIDADEVSNVPDELRALVDLTRVRLDLDEEERTDRQHDPFAVALAMAEVITGVVVGREDIERASRPDAASYPVRWLTYVDPS